LKIQIINGPNLNLLGRREPHIYGNQSFETFFEELQNKYKNLELFYFQSNSEGELIDKIHQIGFDFDLIILNAGAYTHTSLALADAIAAINTPVVEVHVSNIYARQKIRHKSMLAPFCKGCITGFGLKSYELAILSKLIV